jgi:hypothetical protein
MNMSCAVLDHEYFDADNGATTDYPGTGGGGAGPNLILSNAPEIVGGQEDFPTAGFLYRATIALGSNLTFRVFLWHINEMGSARYFRIRARTTSGSVTASSRRYSEKCG